MNHALISRLFVVVIVAVQLAVLAWVLWGEWAALAAVILLIAILYGAISYVIAINERRARGR